MCPIVPRKDPVYCAQHVYLHQVNAAANDARATVMSDRRATATAIGNAWADTPPSRSAVNRTRNTLSAIEAESDRSPEGAAQSWQQVSALNHNMGRIEQRIIDDIAKHDGPGTYTDSAGNSYVIDRGESVDWDTEAMLDAVDATVPERASNAEYLGRLRECTAGVQYRPNRMRDLMGGDLAKAFASVHEGPKGIRPLEEDSDETLEDPRKRQMWNEAWETSCEANPSPVKCPRPSRKSVAERLDVLGDLREARATAREALKVWEARATVDKDPGDLVHDTFGAPVGKVTSGLEVRGPQHRVVNDELAKLPDRNSIRAAFTDIASVKGGVRGLKANDIDPDRFRETSDGKWRARASAG